MSIRDQVLAEIDDLKSGVEVRADSVVSRPGRARAKVLQVRLNEDEYEQLAKYAEERELPLSTIARDMILRCLKQPQGTQVETRLAEFIQQASFSLPDVAWPTADAKAVLSILARTLESNNRIAAYLTEHLTDA